MTPIHSKHPGCRLCGSSELSCLIPMKPVPIGEHYTDKKQADAERFPIDIYRCNACGAVQTNDDIDSDFLWKDYTYFSGQTKRIVEHFSDFSEDILDNYFDSKPISVLDIGSNDGSLLGQFKIRNCDVQGIDPARTVVDVANDQGIPTIHSLFNLGSCHKYLQKESYDLITAFNVFAHSPEMESMIKGIEYSLKENGLFCFEVQYLADISQKNILGTFFHEHMIHYSLYSARQFLLANGMEIIDYRRNNIQNGSIIFICKKEGSNIVKQNGADDRISELEALESELQLNTDEWASRFCEKINETRKSVVKLLNEVDFVDAYGAARSGPTLAIQYGFDKKIRYLFDDHPSKVGKYSPYLSLLVKPTTLLKAGDSPNCLVLAYIHAKNIVKQNISYLQEGGRFIIVWPEYVEVTVENYQNYLGS